MNSFDILEALTDMDDDVLLQAEAAPPRRFPAPRLMRWAVAACLTLAILTGVWLGVETSAAERYLRWTVRYREKEVTWLFKDGMEQDGELPAYVPTWLPEGHVQRSSLYWETSRSRIMSYQNSSDEQDWITFHYIQVTDKEIFRLGTLPEGSYRMESVEISGLPGELYTYVDDPDSGELVWIDRKECMVFLLQFDNCGADKAMQVAESVTLIEEE